MGDSGLSRQQRRDFRAMERRLRELDQADARARAAGIDPYDEWLAGRTVPGQAPLPPRGRPTRPRRRHRLRPWLIAVVIGAVTAGAIYAIGAVSPAARTAQRPANMPPPASDAAAEPLGTPAPAPTGPDHYQFIAVQSDRRAGDGSGDAAQRFGAGAADPVTWDPCRPIHYATSGLAPAEGQELLASAFGRISDITGFKLVNDGPTSESAVRDREAYQPARYGERWAPILVAWTTPQRVPELAGGTIGIGGARAVRDPSGRSTFVSGILFLDLPQIEEQLSEAALGGESAIRRAQIRAIMMHEIGHIAGLDHVGDPAQLMYPVAGAVTDFGIGDLRGLARLASGPCTPDL